jgi:hypothetical protein
VFARGEGYIVDPGLRFEIAYCVKSGDTLLNSLGHFLGNWLTGPGGYHSYCRPWVNHVHLALIDNTRMGEVVENKHLTFERYFGRREPWLAKPD